MMVWDDFIDFLINYGWAILIILAFFGTLFYFNVFERFSPDNVEIRLIEDKANTFCDSLIFDDEPSSLLIDKLEKDLPVSNYVLYEGIGMFRFMTDYDEDHNRVLFGVTCEASISVCTRNCDIEVEDYCACNSMKALVFFNDSEVKDRW